MADNNTIDDFLNQLGLTVVKTDEDEKELHSNYDVMAISYLFDNHYYIHVYIDGMIDLSELKGRQLTPYGRFWKTTLPDICNIIEKNLEELGINYKRDVPVRPTPAHRKVSYELLPSLDDRDKTGFFNDLTTAIWQTYLRLYGR